jgi:hypothetical protein
MGRRLRAMALSSVAPAAHPVRREAAQQHTREVDPLIDVGKVTPSLDRTFLRTRY